MHDFMVSLRFKLATALSRFFRGNEEFGGKGLPMSDI